MWRDYYTTQSDVHSPFVRTVYQDEERQSTGMRRSWSSQHIGGSSVMVNVNWTNGRQVSRNIWLTQKIASFHEH